MFKSVMKVSTLLCIACFAAETLCAATFFLEKSGAWNDPATWGEETATPQSGDTVVLHNGRTATVGEGVTVSGVTVQLRRTTGCPTGCVMRIEGGIVTNSILYVGHVQNESPAVTDLAYLELVSGKICSTKVGNSNGVIVRGRGVFIQRGGLLTEGQLDLNKYARYEMSGGTNSLAKFFVSDGIPTGGAEAFTNVYLHGTACFECPWFVDNSATTVIEGPDVTITHSDLDWPLPQNDSNDARAVFRNNFTGEFTKVYCGVGGNSTRHDYTGAVEVASGAVIKFRGLSLAQNTRKNSGSRIFVDDAKCWLPNAYLGWNAQNINGCFHHLFVRNGGHLAIATVNTMEGLPDKDPWAVADGSWGANAAGDLELSNGGVVRIDGGKLRVWDRLYLGPGGDFEMTDGLFLCNRLYTYNSNLPDLPFRLRLKGGTFRVRTTFTPGCPYSAPRTNPPTLDFEQSGGELRADWSQILLSSESTNNVSRYCFSGGVIYSNIYFSVDSRFAEMRRKGSAGSSEFQSIKGVTNFLHTFVLDNSPGNLAPWIFRDGASSVRVGHLRLALDGGVALLSSDTYALMRTRQFEEDGTRLCYGTFLKANNGTAKTKNFASLPDTNLWTTALSSDACTVNATLADPVTATPLSWIDGSFVSPQPLPFGSVPVGRVSKGNLKAWNVDLGVRAPDGSVADAALLAKLTERLSDAGYAVTASPVTGCDLRLSVAPEDVPDNRPFRLAWDFTETVSPQAAEDGTVVTNALLSTVRCSFVPLHWGMTLIVR